MKGRGFIVSTICALLIILLAITVSAVNAQCGTTLNNCASGTLQDVNDNSTHSLWKCNTNSGTNASCYIIKTNSEPVVSGSSSDVDASYQCLTNKIGNRTDLSLQEAIFSTLALGSKQNVLTVIENNKKANENCWPKDGCKLKETALVDLAYDRIGKENSGIKQWIVSKNATSADLNWYLEIDVINHETSQCRINYDGSDKTINIDSNMQLSADAGNCLTRSSSGYWLRIGNNCLGKTFSISCDKDFITTLIYQKNSGETVYVLSNTHSAASMGTTEEKVTAKCFKTGTACDYEGTLWATLALQKQGSDVSDYLPYLIALADENERYFPAVFLYKIAGGEDQYNKVIQSQKSGKYWEINSGNRYYDTSLAMLALSGSNANEYDNAKSYLLSVRTNDKCWNNNNIRDTAFVLYAGWPKEISTSSGGGTTTKPSCTASGGFCAGAYDCVSAGGLSQTSYSCPRVTDQCCSINPLQQSCSAKGGILCDSNEQCDGESTTSTDLGTCCLGTCEPISEQFTCEQAIDRTCKTSCGDNENEILGETCSSGVCCEVATTPEPVSGSKAWIWILILGILIVLVLILILFRDKIRFWWHSYSGKAKVTPVTRPGSGAFNRPIMPVRPMSMSPMGRPGQMNRPMPRPMPRPITETMRQPARPSAPSKKPVSDKDKEMEETLKKLREMSK